MSWLRLDDAYDTHPKLLELSELERWRWTRVLLYCARHRTEGKVTVGVLRELGAARFVKKLLEQRLLIFVCLPDVGNVYLVNDWDEFNPARRDEEELEDAVRDAIAAHPDVSANEIARIVGGNRKVVLALVKRFRGGSPNGSGTGGGTGSQGGSHTGAELVTRAGARPRSRTRTPTPEGQEPVSGDSTVAVNPARENGNTDEQEAETDELERRRALHDLDQRLLRDMP